MDTRQSASPPGRVYFAVGGPAWQSCLWRVMAPDGGGSSGGLTDGGDHPGTRRAFTYDEVAEEKCRCASSGPSSITREARTPKEKRKKTTERTLDEMSPPSCRMRDVSWENKMRSLSILSSRCSACAPLQKPGGRGYCWRNIRLFFSAPSLNVEINSWFKKTRQGRERSGWLACCAEKRPNALFILI